MCMSSPSIPNPTPVQEVKQPDSSYLTDKARRNRAGGMAGGSLLTSPSGISAGALSTGKSSLLGG